MQPLPVAVDLHADVLGVSHDCSLDETLHVVVVEGLGAGARGAMLGSVGHALGRCVTRVAANDLPRVSRFIYTPFEFRLRCFADEYLATRERERERESAREGLGTRPPPTSGLRFTLARGECIPRTGIEHTARSDRACTCVRVHLF